MCKTDLGRKRQGNNLRWMLDLSLCDSSSPDELGCPWPLCWAGRLRNGENVFVERQNNDNGPVWKHANDLASWIRYILSRWPAAGPAAAAAQRPAGQTSSGASWNLQTQPDGSVRLTSTSQIPSSDRRRAFTESWNHSGLEIHRAGVRRA